MTNPIQQIYDFNYQAGLLEKPYDDFLESSFQIEEALEGFEHLHALADILGVDPNSPKLPRELSRIIAATAQKGTPNPAGYNVWSDLSDLERFDKALDAIVFAFGSLFKLGLTPGQALRGLSIVMNANMAKLSMPKDAHGKLTKPPNFVGPEAQLQLILKERTCDN